MQQENHSDEPIDHLLWGRNFLYLKNLQGYASSLPQQAMTLHLISFQQVYH